MPLSPSDNPILRKLESVYSLSGAERDAILKLPMQVQDIRADQDIVREGDRPTRCCAILEGFAATYTVTGDGKRQIMSFHIAGDIPDLQSVHLEVLDISLGTITPCRVALFSTRQCASCVRIIPGSGVPSGVRH